MWRWKNRCVQFSWKFSQGQSEWMTQCCPPQPNIPCFLSQTRCATRGGLKTKRYTLTQSEQPLSTGHWIQYSNAYCFSRRSWIQRKKESTMLMRGLRNPELRFRHPNSWKWHFPRKTQPQRHSFPKAWLTTPAPTSHTFRASRIQEKGL